MKQVLLVGLLIAIAHVAWGQRIDPSYSVNNYKHPNKAAYARLHNLDRVVHLQSESVRQNDNYKQAFNKVSRSKKFVIKSEVIDSNKSSKHPYGL